MLLQKIRFLPYSFKKEMTRVFGGMFVFQPNSNKRIFEYRWAFYAVNLRKGMNVLDFGGGVTGFQIVLSRNGLNVEIVGPGLEANRKGRPVTSEIIEKLNNEYKLKASYQIDQRKTKIVFRILCPLLNY